MIYLKKTSLTTGVELVVKIYNHASKINDLKIYNFPLHESMHTLCTVVMAALF